MTKTAHRRVVDLLNAISDLHPVDLHHVLRPWADDVAEPDFRDSSTNLKKFVEEITKIATDYHPEETGEARTRIWEYVLEDIYGWGNYRGIRKATST
jgi:hypothetical protein